MAPPAAAAKKAKAAADAAEAASHLAAYLSGQVALLDWRALAALGQSKPPFVAGAAALPPSSLHASSCSRAKRAMAIEPITS